MTETPELFTRELWHKVATDITDHAANDWWTRYGSDVIGAGTDEVREIFSLMRDADRVAAKYALVRRMTQAEWTAYRSHTTSQLAGSANRRARLAQGFRELTETIMKIIGAAVIGAFG